MFEIADVIFIFICLFSVVIYYKNRFRRIERRQKKVEDSMLSLTLLDKRINEMKLMLGAIRAKNEDLVRDVSTLKDDLQKMKVYVELNVKSFEHELETEEEPTQFHINIKNAEPETHERKTQRQKIHTLVKKNKKFK